MMPTLRVSDANWERMKKHARPLEDSADDVIGRALDALEALPAKAPPPPTASFQVPRRPAGQKLPQKEFRVPLLQALVELGGEAPVKQIREVMEKKMAPRLLASDYENVSSGDPRWWNAICWERNELVNEGLMRDDSERGVWAISGSGE